jgi:translocation and assembly module TamB
LSKRRSIALLLLAPAGVFVLALLAYALAAVYAPNLPQVRSLLRVELEQLLDDLLQGDVQIDRITELTLAGVRAEGITVHDAQGRTVLRAKRLSLGLRSWSLLRLKLRFTHGLLEQARIRAIPSDTAAITLFDALSPPATPATSADGSSGGLDILFEHIHVKGAELYGDVPGFEDLEVRDVEARGAISIVDGELAVRVSQTSGALTRPYEHPITIEQATYALDTSPLRMVAKARLSHELNHARATLSYRAPEVGDGLLDLLLALEPIDPELLADLRIPAATVLLSPLRGYVRLSGPLRALAFSSTLDTDAGQVVVHGKVPDDAATVVSIRTQKLELAKLVGYAPELTMNAQIDVNAPLHGPVSMHLRAPTVDLYGVELRSADITASYDVGRLSLQSARVRYGGGHFDVSGHIDSDANLSLRVRSQVPDVARAESIRSTGIRGGLRTDVRIERRAELFSIDGSVGLVAPVLGGFGAKEMVIEGTASANSDFSNLRVNATGASWGTTVLGYAVGDFEYKLRGKDPQFTADFGLIDRRARTADAHLALTVQKDGGYHVLLSPLEVGVKGREPWRAKADVAFERDGIEFRQVFLANGPQRLDLTGAYSYAKEYKVEGTLQSFDLGGLRELSGLDLADLDGTIDGKLSLTGVPGHPRIDAQGSLRSGVFLGINDLTVLLSLVSVERRFDIDSELVLPDKSRIALYAGGEPGTGPDWLTQLSAGNYSFGIDTERMPFDVARPWLGWMGMEPPPGTLTATVRGAGTLSSPYLDVKSKVAGLELPGWPKLDIELDVEHDGKRATLRDLSVSDPLGTVGKLSGFIDASTHELSDPWGLRTSLGTRAYEVLLSWEDRRLDQLPGSLHMDVPMPSWGSLRIAQTHTGPSLNLTTRLGWPEATQGLDACGAYRHPELALTLDAHDGRTTGKFTASLDREELAMADLEADTPIAPWLTGEQALFLPRTSFTMNASTEAAEEVPGLCELVAGPLRVDVSALDAFADPPELHFEVASTGLQLVANESQRQRLGSLRDARATGRPFSLDASGGVEGPSFVFLADVDQGSGSKLKLRGSLPRAAVYAGPTQSPRSEWPLARLTLEAVKLELASLLVALPISIRASGSLDGKAQVRYDFAADDVSLAGALALSEGKLILGVLGQELSDLRGRLTLQDDTIRIEELKVRDFDGKLGIGGTFTFAGLRELDTELTFDMADFPIRRESAQVSRLTGALKLRATSTLERTRAELTFGDLRVNLPNDLGQGLQSLAEHRDIVVRGQKLPEPADNPHLFELRVFAQNPPFRVLRSDLNAEVSCDLTLRYRAPSLTLQGNAEIRRGNFDLYGKRFELVDSRLAFDGSETIDPLVSIEAKHSVGSDEIGVRVEGRVSDPKISFTHSNPAITDTGAIITQLLGARASDPTAQNADASGAAAGILAGVTAGLLTQGARDQLGGALPVLSLESSSTTLRTARIRAGVQLDQLIERRLGRLSRVVRGAYVEGFVAPGAGETVDTTVAPQSRSGGLLELRFPKDLVGTFEYRPVQNWRLDLAWEP